VSAALLELGGVVGGYGAVTAVHGIDLAAEAGRVTALIGSNGAGKSTTLRIVSGLLPARQGAIRFDDSDVTRLSTDQRVDRGIVMVPEGRLIFPQMSVEENLRIGAFAPRGRARSARTLDAVYGLFPRLAERRRQAGGTLSGGEQQMLALGRGLMALPRLLLLDEPTLGLAPQVAAMIFDAIGRLLGDGLTILIAEQDVARTLALAHVAYVIENGRIVKSGAGNELLGDAAVKTAYLGL
jgi:branched-chain amino acid transport system ATP-binding protein